MFVVTVDFEVEREESEAFLERVRRQARDSLEREPGCRRFDVCVCATRPGRVFLYELYDDAEAFAAHLASAHFRDFDREVSPVTRSKKVDTWMLA